MIRHLKNNGRVFGVFISRGSEQVDVVLENVFLSFTAKHVLSKVARQRIR